LRTGMLLPTAAALALLAMSLWWWAVPRYVNLEKPVGPILTTDSVITEPNKRTQVVLLDESPMVNGGDKLIGKWRLSGVAKVDGSSVLILSDRRDKTTRWVSVDDDIDGWTVTAAGTNYGVFARNGREARLDLNERTAR
jgi:hypothetical protein